MSNIDAYDVPLSGMEQKLLEWTQEAVDLRYGNAEDPRGKLSTGTDETSAEAVAYMRRVRARADRVGELLQAAKRARGRAKRALDAIAFAAENEIAEGIKKQGRAEFQSSREREVTAKLEAFETRRTEHQARRLLGVADETVDVINQMNWSLDGLSRDIRATLHALQFESSLER